MHRQSLSKGAGLRRILCGLVIAAGCAVLTDSSLAGQTDPAVGRDTLVIGADRNFNSLDVIRTNTPDGNRFRMLVYDSLYGFDPKGNLEPHLAVEMTASEDAKTFTYKLRDGVKFHDGTAFDSADVKFSMERILDPQTKSPDRPQFAKIVENIDTPDPLTVVFHLSRADGVFPNKIAGYLAIYPVDPAEPATETSYARKPVSVGPYKVKSFPENNRTLELERFDGYWGGEVPTKNITFKVITEATSRINAIVTGEVDLASGIPGKDKARLEGLDYLKVTSTPLDAPLMLKPYTNNPKSPMFKREVRQALDYALDKEAIIKHVLYGVGEPMGAPLSRYFPYGGSGKIAPYPYDPAKATELLAKAGYPNGFTTKLWINSTYPKELGEAVAAYWGQVGVKVELQPIEWQTYMRMVNQGELDPMYVGINANPIYDPIHQVIGHYSIGGTWNTWDNPEAQKLIEEVIGVVDTQKRAELFEKIGQIMHDDQPSIQISELFETYALKKDFDWTPSLGSTLLNVRTAAWK